MAEPLRHRMRVRYAECDPQGVVFNARYLEYFDHGMTELLRAALGSYESLHTEHGVDLVVAEANIRFRSSLRFDEEFDLKVAVATLGMTSIITAIAVERLDGAIAAEGELRHVVVELGGGGKTPIPEPVRIALSAHLAPPDAATGDHSRR
jgi:acyl-CoA thioester hydrolase